MAWTAICEGIAEEDWTATQHDCANEKVEICWTKAYVPVLTALDADVASFQEHRFKYA